MRFPIALILALTTPYIYGQVRDVKNAQRGALIQFDKTTHNFGRVSEDILYATCRFNFVNTGDAPLLISNVQTSCGCTTPDWTRDTIMPGESGFVDAKYETINRIGSFNKSVTVYSNAANSPFVHLDISGEVYKEKSSADGIPVPDYGKLYFDQPTLEFNPIYDNQTDTLTARLTNATPFTATFQPMGALPAFCKVTGWPTSLEPNESVKITVILDGKGISTFGFGAFEIPMMSDNPVTPSMGLYVAYTRKQYFPKLSAKELKKAPKISFDREFHDFGEHKSGDEMVTTFKVSNTGKSDLKLHMIYPECSCLKVDFEKNSLKPGESMDIRVRFDTVNKTGQSNQGIWIVSNDPTRDEMHIYVRANLPKHKFNCPTCN